jgi:hypothetical protein
MFSEALALLLGGEARIELVASLPASEDAARRAHRFEHQQERPRSPEAFPAHFAIRLWTTRDGS